MTRRPILLLTVALLLAPLAGCSTDQKVGNAELLDFKEREASRLGAIKRTESPTPSARPAPKAQRSSAAVVATRRPVAPAPAGGASKPVPVAPVPTITIEITGDAFQPYTRRVFKGTKVKFVNRDSLPRTATADDGSWDSGPIEPGQSWTYLAATVATFGYHDETRPFIVGQLEVVNR